MTTRLTTLVTASVLTLSVCMSAHADVIIDTVTVGNPGNIGELSGGGAGGYGPDRICGAVDYVYDIGKYEVTAAQYTEFLNAVAGVDAYALYNTSMWSSDYGCKIERYDGNGTPGDLYQYRVAPDDWADRPVNFVSWGDAARFCNWLHNGQPTGTLTGNPSQDAGLTEDGSYYLNGATSNAELWNVTRNTNRTWVIPSEDEWYKAAYHKNDGPTGNYWDFPTGTDSEPSNELIPPDPGNNANYFGGWGGPGNGTYTIGSPYWRTEVGDFENSEGPYGTFDQGGNVWEWNEAKRDDFGDYRRGLGGGSFGGENGIEDLRASDRNNMSGIEDRNIGFRLALIPEPSSLFLLVAASAAGVRRR